MPADIPVIEARVELDCQNRLGEGILWDSKNAVLNWVDIDRAEVHTYHPGSKQYGVDTYKDESRYLSTIALRKDAPGFIATLQHDIVLLPAPSPLTSTSTSPVPTPRKVDKKLSAPLPADPVRGLPTRFNDGAAAPDGSFWVGSMTIPEVIDGSKRGELWRYTAKGEETRILPEVGCSNGIGWTNDGKTMYYVDSDDHQVLRFSTTPTSPHPSDRTVIATTPGTMGAPGTPSTSQGVFDGLCVDGLGNVWVARWADERIVGYTPEGEVICYIWTKGCKSPTIPCFGGKNLDIMYIASAHSELAGQGDQQDQYPHSGAVYKVDFGPGSEVRKYLPENWSGADRFRFVG